MPTIAAPTTTLPFSYGLTGQAAVLPAAAPLELYDPVLGSCLAEAPSSYAVADHAYDSLTALSFQHPSAPLQQKIEVLCQHEGTAAPKDAVNQNGIETKALSTWESIKEQAINDPIPFAVNATEGLAVMGAALYALRCIKKYRAKHLSPELKMDNPPKHKKINLVTNVIRVGAVAALICGSLNLLGLQLGELLASLSVVSAALSLALRELLANVAGGLVIRADSRYKIGNYIEHRGFRGRVVSIGLLKTTLQGLDDAGNIVTIHVNNSQPIGEHPVKVIDYDKDIVDTVRAGDYFRHGQILGRIETINEFGFIYTTQDGNASISGGVMRFEDLNEGIYENFGPVLKKIPIGTTFWIALGDEITTGEIRGVIKEITPEFVIIMPQDSDFPIPIRREDFIKSCPKIHSRTALIETEPEGEMPPVHED